MNFTYTEEEISNHMYCTGLSRQAAIEDLIHREVSNYEDYLDAELRQIAEDGDVSALCEWLQSTLTPLLAKQHRKENSE